MKNLLKINFVIVIVLFAFSQTNYGQWYTNGPSIVYTTDDVGIGTSSPAYKLDLSGYLRVNSTSYPGRDYRIQCTSRQDIYANNDLVTHVDGNKEFRVGVTGSNSFFCITDGAGSKKFWVYENGRVGIGTSSPGTLLHVNGSMYVNGKISFYYSGSYYNGITNDGSGNMVFNVGPTAPILKLSSSTVSIGCDGSSGKLNVNGKIQAKEIEIKSGPCSDFVFEQNYQLMPLNELENFVNDNKHLPEIPSAKKFEEDGYNLGEMDDLLLRKIEELTLYIIDLKKEIEVLKQK